MSKRMQVLLDEEDFEELRRIAKLKGMTLAAWVRLVLKRAASREPLKGRAKKIDAIRQALTHEFPAPPLAEMIKEIEKGYSKELPE